MAERIYIVGHGAVTCLGRDMDTTWKGLIQGRSGIRRHESLDAGSFLCDLAGMVPDVGQPPSSDDRTITRLSARFLRFAVASAREAWADSGLDRKTGELDPHRAAVVVGSAFGGVDFLESQQARMRKRQDLSVSPFLIPGLLINQAAGQVSERLGLFGPSVGPANACASGGHAIILGAMFLRCGDADVALCGAAESAFTPAVVNGFATMKALIDPAPGDRCLEDPGRASRPFSVDRAGFVMAEGAGMVVIATESAIKRLGLTPQVELAGYAVNTDGNHITLPCQDRIVRGVFTAMRKAGVSPGDIDYYNAHGTSTPVNDRTETSVLKECFGEHARNLPVSSIKGALGHGLGAASAIEAAVCVRAVLEQLTPPTINYLRDPELDLDYVPGEARAAPISTVMSASFGFGGTNNILVLRKA